ncbi:MAG: hypothetical protein HYY20_02230 [Candidatus Tectomicrobia bacterium]|uniref:Uncharacterized protein n=1 Tax=Tectimicrobiota bacterium TaxID=2528274 RepID=A0A932CLP0_UNCTE|nr:hypothetical protein [Candidatus Tectomicrobia bacterium]
MRKRSSFILIGALALGVILSWGILRAASDPPRPSGREMDAEVQERMRKAAQMADALEDLALRAFALSRIASGLSRIDPAEARQVAAQAWEAAQRIDSVSYRNFVTDLEGSARRWGKDEREKIGPLLERIERTRSRSWLLGVIAADTRTIDPAWAERILEQAIARSEAGGDSPGRDFDLRALAAEMAKRDRARAIGVAGKIRDPQVRSWALRAIASEIASSDPAGAVTVWRMAIAEAEKIQETVPSELDGNPRLAAISPESRQRLLLSGRVRRAAARAQVLGRIALDLHRVDPAMSRSLFHRAVQVAEGIEKPYTQAYTLSELAGTLAPADPGEAARLAARIARAHADARFSAWMSIAARTMAREDLERAAAAAGEIEEPYDRAKALGRVAVAMGPLDPGRGLQLAETIAYPYLRDEALGALALKWLREKDREKEAVALVERIADPLVRGRTFQGLAVSLAPRDPQRAKKLFARAASLAEEIHSSVLLWEILPEWVKVDPDRLYETIGRTEGDAAHRSAALRRIALDRWQSDRAQAGLVLEVAVKAAEKSDEAYLRSELLRQIAVEWTEVNGIKAGAIFWKAVEAARQIG